jgi:hypothetical protein
MDAFWAQFDPIKAGWLFSLVILALLKAAWDWWRGK